MNLSSIRAAVGTSMFDSLVGRDGENRIVPQLAESWKLLDDTTWQFKLRKGVVFHDGERFDAEAVRFTIQRVLDPNQKSPNRANIAEISRVDVLDDWTVNLVTQQPYAPLINRLIDFPILPPRYTAEKGNQAFALRPVGTGPFRFVELIKDDHLIVEAFDRHWRGAPKVRRIVFKPIPEPFTRAAALRNSEVDLITTVPPNLGRELARVPGIRVQQVLFDSGRNTMDPGRRRKIYADLARAMVEDATWVFLMQQVDIYATRDRLTWTLRPDQWMLFHDAALR